MHLSLITCITTKDEPEAFRLISRIAEQSEARLVICDDFSSPDWISVLKQWQAVYPFIELKQHALNNDFGAHRQWFKEQIGEENWIVMLDADEWVGPKFLATVAYEIISNPEADLIQVPRLNTLFGEGVPTDRNRNYTEKIPLLDWAQLKDPTYLKINGVDNWPDWQWRIYQNKPYLHYQNKVHEMLIGAQHPIALMQSDLTIIHHKSIKKFTRMNKWYSSL
jgi:glycosyltransferase involved in cell wall biosynthesis